MSAGGSVRVILFALFANLGIAIAKTVGTVITGSSSLAAEAIHSFVDCANQVLLLWGNKASQKPPSKTHQLGYGREAFFWSFIVAVMLFTMGGVYSVYEGIHKLSGDESLESPAVALIILVFGIVLEGFSFRACIQEVDRINRFGSYWAWFRKTTNADLLVIFTEDLAALLGLAFAAVCVSLAWITGNPMWDAMGSILVGVLLVFVAAFLGNEIKSLIVGEAPATDFLPDVENIIEENIPGGKVLAFIALQTGSSEVMVSYKISAGEITEVKTLIDAINRSERKVRKRFPEIRWQFVEPDTEA